MPLWCLFSFTSKKLKTSILKEIYIIGERNYEFPISKEKNIKQRRNRRTS